MSTSLKDIFTARETARENVLQKFNQTITEVKFLANNITKECLLLHYDPQNISYNEDKILLALKINIYGLDEKEFSKVFSNDQEVQDIRAKFYEMPERILSFCREVTWAMVKDICDMYNGPYTCGKDPISPEIQQYYQQAKHEVHEKFLGLSSNESLTEIEID